MLTVLFDIDDTVSVTSYKWMEMAKLYMWSHGYTKPGITPAYGMEKIFNLSEEENKNYHDYMDENFPYSLLEIVPGADRFIHWLLSKNARVLFITNRSNVHKKTTTEWVSRKLGIKNPEIHFDVDDNKFNRILDRFPSSVVLVDNSVKRCLIAKERGMSGILFTGIGVDNVGFTEKDQNKITQASTYKEVVKAMSMHHHDNINVGDYVAINSDKVFKEHPKLPKELKEHVLKVVDLYRDPETEKLVRVSVTCDFVGNPKSKYNCFYISGRYVSKVNDYASVKQYINKMLTPSKNTGYTVVGKGKKAKQIIPITYNALNNSDNWVEATTGDGWELFVPRSTIFDTKNEAKQYILREE